jgi:hypothetical protein
MKISFENHGVTVTAELPWDSDLDQVFNVVKGMLVSLTWHESMIDDYFIEKGKELEEFKNEEKDETED